MNNRVQPTDDIAQAKEDIARHGFALFAGALNDAETREVRERLLRAADLSEKRGIPTTGYVFDPDDKNRRVFDLFNLDPIFIDLIRRPLALEFVRHVIGDSFLISNFSANITAPGNQPMQLHADQGYVLPPWPQMPLACNVAWLLDDFTVQNGGTCYVPGSHLKGHGPDPNKTYETVPIEAPAGSILIMEGRLWHQTGANTTSDQTRAALFGYYVLRWLRPQINWNATLTAETVASADEEFLHMLGFYSGNVEFQIPAGDDAPVTAPTSLVGDLATFALGNASDAGND